MKTVFMQGNSSEVWSTGLALLPSAAISGTAASTWYEDTVVAGGKTIIITLTNATWVAAGGTFDAQRQNIINGIDSAQSEAAGWDVKKALLAVTDVVRTSATVVTITLDALASYAITANETLTVTVPGGAVSGGSSILASPTLTITEGTAGLPPEAPAWVLTATSLIDYDFSTASGSMPSGWTDSSNHGVSWADATPQGSHKSYRTLVSDATAPQSPPSIARQWFLTGMLADSSGSPAGIYQGTSVYNKIFGSLNFRIKAGFEWQEVGGFKLFYIPSPEAGGHSEWFMFVGSDVYNTPGGNYNIGIVDNLNLNGLGTYLSMVPRTTIAHATTGNWCRLSWEALASTGGVKNGSINLWVDGTSQGESATAIKYTSSGTGNLTGINFDSYWGGGGGTAKTQDDYVDYDHIRIWGGT